MELYELKPYIIESCDYLGIDIKEISSDILLIQIPDNLKDELNGINNTKVSFVKTSDPNITYLTFESFFTQKIAQLVADRNTGIGTGTKLLKLDAPTNYIKAQLPSCNIQLLDISQENTDYLFIWFKTTVRGNLVEEYLKGFKYNLKEDKVETYNEDINFLLEDIKDELLLDVNEAHLDTVLREMLSLAKEDAEIFIEKKKIENKEILDKEIKRINDYYDMLYYENQLAESSKGVTPKEELELLQREREGLISQQIHKYEYKSHDTTIEPIAILMLRQTVETATVHAVNNYGQISLHINAENTISLECALTNDTNGPFTITSDDMIVQVDNAFNCSECNRLLDKSKESSCKVCDQKICNDCEEISSLSRASLCHDHTQRCQSCIEVVASDEFHLCVNCNQFYCLKCNESSLCSLCKSLQPIQGVTPQVNQIINLLPNDFSAKKYESSEKGNRVNLLGKGTLFKSFLIVFDKNTNTIIEKQKYGLFNKKK
ncbi:hypothetical protein [Bacillus horti]|uniref:B box-type domain-containing protein n=1 Tax=Caldalkalibacillus horti TaxID=77523 RepID=A0ABT9VZ65_9BACI|nr:hypothetical protein [Bacillus horti]MDQ0166112.1 hypothetical protein [Bacillus horti]